VWDRSPQTATKDQDSAATDCLNQGVGGKMGGREDGLAAVVDC